MPRVTYEYIRNLDPATIGKMSKSQAVDLLRKIRKKFKTREKQLSRVEDKVYSPALEKMKDYYEAQGKTPPSKISRNKAINEIFNLQAFFNSETSTVKGARSVMREQDIRIFGSTPSGQPKKRMTTEERSKFWSLYTEFTSSYKNLEYIYSSGRIQQYLGDFMIRAQKSGKDFEVSADIMNQLYTALMSDTEEYEYGANVYSGKWSDL